MTRLVFRAFCKKPDGEAVVVINSDYTALISGIERYGFAVLYIERVSMKALS